MKGKEMSTKKNEKPVEEFIDKSTQTYLASVNDPPEPGTSLGPPIKVPQRHERGYTTLAMASANLREGLTVVEVLDVQNTTLCYLLREEK